MQPSIADHASSRYTIARISASCSGCHKISAKVNVNALALMPAFSTDNLRKHSGATYNPGQFTPYVNFLILNYIEYFNRRFINHLHVTYHVLPAVKISSIVCHFRAIARPTCVGHSAYYIVRNRWYIYAFTCYYC